MVCLVHENMEPHAKSGKTSHNSFPARKSTQLAQKAFFYPINWKTLLYHVKTCTGMAQFGGQIGLDSLELVQKIHVQLSTRFKSRHEVLPPSSLLWDRNFVDIVQPSVVP